MDGTPKENQLSAALAAKFNFDGKVTDGEKRCILLPSIHNSGVLTLKYDLCFTDCCACTEDGCILVKNHALVCKKDSHNLCTYENSSTTTTEICLGKCHIANATLVRRRSGKPVNPLSVRTFVRRTLERRPPKREDGDTLITI